jgi:sugar phosphate isomerase/epimerase
MTRRSFLRTTALAGAASLPNMRAASTSGVKLGIDSYSLSAWRWKDIEVLDYAAGLKLDAVQLSSLGDYQSLDPAHLAKVKDHAARLGIAVDAGIGCICSSSKVWSDANGTPEEYLRKGLAVGKAVGSRTLRCFLGSGDDRRGALPIEAHIENTVKALKTVRSAALDSEVRIAVENHAGDMQARELKMLIEEAGKDYVGACLDTGNAMWVVEHPMTTLEVLGSYVVTSHWRDSVVWEHPRGATAQWVALGDGSVDFKAFAKRYRELCPSAAVHLENITGRVPQVLPYLEADFWKVFPKASAAEFAQFVALAKSGQPLMKPMLVTDWPGLRIPEYAAAMKVQQKRDLERGLEYAKKTLDLGVRWRS